MLDVGPTVAEKLTAEGLTKLHYVRFGDKFVLHPRDFVLGSTLNRLGLPKKPCRLCYFTVVVGASGADYRNSDWRPPRVYRMPYVGAF